MRVRVTGFGDRFSYPCPPFAQHAAPTQRSDSSVATAPMFSNTRAPLSPVHSSPAASVVESDTYSDVSGVPLPPISDKNVGVSILLRICNYTNALSEDRH